jgi:AcrR family transcriptional regulator
VEQAVFTREPPTLRGRERRDRIIAAATDLFYERGFHPTGIDDIGSAAGITGPGIYRHFAGKDEILIAVFDRIWMMLKEAIDSSRLLEAGDALEYLISRHVQLSVDHQAEFALLAHDLRFLPSDYQALARMNRATYRDTWANLIVSVRPTVTREEAQLMATSAWRLSSGIGNAVDESGLDRNRVESILEAMTRDAVYGAIANG